MASQVEGSVAPFFYVQEPLLKASMKFFLSYNVEEGFESLMSLLEILGCAS